MFKIKSLMREKKIGSSDLALLCFQLTSLHCRLRGKDQRERTTTSLWQKKAGRGGWKGENGNDAYFNPEGAVAPRQRRQFSGANLPPARIHGVYSTSSV